MECKHTIPSKLSLHDDRCWTGYCEKCNKNTYYCEELKKYICCECCEREEG